MQNDKLGMHKHQETVNAFSLEDKLIELTKNKAHQYDPVRFQYIKSLAKKSSSHRHSVSQLLENKAVLALTEYCKDLEGAKKHSEELIIDMVSETPDVEEKLKCLFNEGNLKEIKKLAAQKELSKINHKTLFRQLTQEISKLNNIDVKTSPLSFEDELKKQEQEFVNLIGVKTDSALETKQTHNGFSELTAMRHFRQSQIKHYSEQRVCNVMQEGPDEPGPLNSQALIIRSLEIMQNISPSYVNRFVSFVDNMLWLEQVDLAHATTSAKAKIKESKQRKF